MYIKIKFLHKSWTCQATPKNEEISIQVLILNSCQQFRGENYNNLGSSRENGSKYHLLSNIIQGVVQKKRNANWRNINYVKVWKQIRLLPFSLLSDC